MKIFPTTGSAFPKTPAMTFIETIAGKRAGLYARPPASNQLNQLNQPIILLP
jgi:hypothetical protein